MSYEMSHCHLDVPPLNNVLPMFLQLATARQKSQQNMLLTFHAQNTIACEIGASTPQHQPLNYNHRP